MFCFFWGPFDFLPAISTPVRQHLQRLQMSALWTCPTRPAAQLLMTNKSLDGAVVVAIIRPLFSPSLLIAPLCWPVWIESSHRVTRSMTWSSSAISAKRFSKCCTLQYIDTPSSVRPSIDGPFFLIFFPPLYWCSCIWTGKVRWDYTHTSIPPRFLMDSTPPRCFVLFDDINRPSNSREKTAQDVRPPARFDRLFFFFCPAVLGKK